MRWPGAFCEPCLDWIIEDDNKWWRDYCLRILWTEQCRHWCRTQCVSKGDHKLKTIFGIDALGELIANMTVDFGGADTVGYQYLTFLNTFVRGADTVG